jgi:hypothetical protein
MKKKTDTAGVSLDNARIVSVTKDYSQADNANFLKVDIEIADGDETVTRSLGFPFDTSAEDIEKEVAKYEATYFSDKELGEASKEVEAANSQADETINKLMNK